ncbi:L-lactate dehydrogenase complex protein LldG [Spirosoma lacussanchae]|uniref:LutC/YkgG family protein n=1 Tax=Spirosoma lacussanchae TaxID=1884249 RepID=UPI00110924FF|nr:LUD domain-containing protein [Spirosoma lacussanchae]
MTTARDTMLARIRQNKPEPLPLPDVPTFVNEADDLSDRFEKALAFVGGQLADLQATPASLVGFLQKTFPDAQRIASSVPLPGLALVPVGPDTDKQVLEQIDVAVLRGDFAVAENAAIWVPEASMLHRALPFITQYLVLVVDRDALVPNMHVAYERLDRSRLTYGTFIAGPSKTADIEQSLVIGAHGARSLTVVLPE